MALVATVAAAIVLAVGPLVSVCTTSAEQAEGCSNTATSFHATEGAGILPFCLVPVAAALVPLLRRSERTLRISAIVLTVIFLVTGPYGVLLFPAVAAAWAAACAAADSD